MNLDTLLQCNRPAGYGNGEQYRKDDDGARVVFALHPARCCWPFSSGSCLTFEYRVRKRLAFLSACCASASGVSACSPSCSIFLHASAYVSIFLHKSACVLAFLRLTAVCEIKACVEYCAVQALGFLSC
jgi:hypothetical protein